MKTFGNRYLFCFGLLSFLLFSLCARAQAQSPDVEAAKKDGKVVIYGTVVPQIMSLIQRGFEKKYGIKVDYWRASATKVMDRVLTEWRAGRPGFDVVIAIRGAQLLMKKEGLFTRYVPPSSENFPAKFKDKDGILTAWRVTPVGILYNTELVKPGETPKTLDDLLDPKWKKKIVMPDPTQHTSTAQFLWNLEKIKGERWLEYVRALAKQQPHLLESMAPVPNTLAKGEGHLGLTYLQYVTQVKGPLGFALMDKILTDTNDMALSSRAANPNAAKVFMEYACSLEGQKTVAEAGEFVLYSGIYPVMKDADKVVSNMVFMDNPTEEQLKKLSAEFRQIFFGK